MTCVARMRKTDRPAKSYPKAMIDDAVSYALKTTICAAARATGISTHCIRRHLILAGHKPARRGKRPRVHHADGRRLAAVTSGSQGAQKVRP